MSKLINLIKLVKNYFVISLLLVIFLASSWSLLGPGFFRTHDYVHGARIAEMARALSDGHFPVRWSQNFGYGFGMPLFEFYAPLPYYVGAGFYLLGADLVTTVKILFIISNLIAMIGAYYLGKNLVGNRGGLLLAAAFTLAPYRAVNLFVRGALSEIWGIMALPWILLGINLVSQKNSRSGWLILVLSLTTLMLSHNLTTMIFVPLSVAYGAAYILAHRPSFDQLKTTLVKLAGAYFLAGGLASFYLLPALVEKNLTQVESIVGGYFHYSNHFLYIRQFLIPNWKYGGSGWGPNDDISFFLGYGQLLALIISGLAALYLIKKLYHQQRPILEFKIVFYLAVCALLIISLFMTLLKSQGLWDTLPPLSYIQFPWRFLSAAIMFLAIIVALTLKLIDRIAGRFIFFVVVFLMIVGGNFYYFRPEQWLNNPADLYYADETKIRLSMSDILKDYVPVQMSYEGDLLRAQYAEFTWPAETETIVERTAERLYQFNLPSAQTVTFPIANFAGWMVEVDGQVVTTGTGSTGLLTADVPGGHHRVGVIFAGSPIRRLADMISAISLLILLSILIAPQTPRLKKID